MAGKVSYKTIGEWRKEIGQPLKDVLAVSMDVMGRNGEQACRHALILMAQSARALARVAPRYRKVLRDENGEYVEIWSKGTMKKLYAWAFSDNNPNRLEGLFGDARVIKNRELARRSWMWGLAKLGAKVDSKAISGTSRVATITHENVNGYIKENRLDYIQAAMPAGWEGEVARKAGNKILAQARRKIEREFVSRTRRRERAQMRSVSSYFLKAVA